MSFLPQALTGVKIC